jgi:hypothetical protein
MSHPPVIRSQLTRVCNSPPDDTTYDAAQRQFLRVHRDRLNIFCNTQRPSRAEFGPRRINVIAGLAG